MRDDAAAASGLLLPRISVQCATACQIPRALTTGHRLGLACSASISLLFSLEFLVYTLHLTIQSCRISTSTRSGRKPVRHDPADTSQRVGIIVRGQCLQVMGREWRGQENNHVLSSYCCIHTDLDPAACIGVFDGVSPNLRVSVSEQAQTIVPYPDKAISKPLRPVVIMIHEMVIVYCSSTPN